VSAAKAWTTALAALIFGARNHNGGGKIPSQLFPLLAIYTHIIHTHTHSSDETIVQKAAVAASAARTFPAIHPILKPTVAALPTSPRYTLVLFWRRVYDYREPFKVQHK